MVEKTEDKTILRVYYDVNNGTFAWDFGEHKISCFHLIGILHAVQNELENCNYEISEAKQDG